MHGVLEDFKRVHLQTEDTSLWSVPASSKEPHHVGALVQGAQNLRDVRTTGERHARHLVFQLSRGRLNGGLSFSENQVERVWSIDGALDSED